MAPRVSDIATRSCDGNNGRDADTIHQSAARERLANRATLGWRATHGRLTEPRHRCGWFGDWPGGRYGVSRRASRAYDSYPHIVGHGWIGLACCCTQRRPTFDRRESTRDEYGDG